MRFLLIFFLFFTACSKKEIKKPVISEDKVEKIKESANKAWDKL